MKLIKNMFNINLLRKDFPILHRKINGKPLIYFDNAASSQKPNQVINAISNYYQFENSNVHRGVHYLSSCATEKHEDVRDKIRGFINAKHSHEIIFTKGTTESINLVASSFGKKFLSKDDEVIISALEHHSNIVPWQMICDEKGAKLRVIPVNDEGEIRIDKFKKLLNERTKIVAISHISNTLGTINPVKEIISIVRNSDLLLKNEGFEVPVLIDGAQAAPHFQIDVQDLDADFYAFSSHKMYGPTGIGILYGKEQWLNQMPPYQGGGDMIKTVSFEKTIYNDLPHKFEAGTPHIAGVIGLGAAMDYMKSIGRENIAEYEQELLNYATQKLSQIDGVRIFGNAKNKVSVISFLVDNIHPYDIGVILDQLAIAVRTGHHCTQPLMDHFHIPGTVRASFAFYNTKVEIDELISGIEKAKKILKK